MDGHAIVLHTPVAPGKGKPLEWPFGACLRCAHSSQGGVLCACPDVAGPGGRTVPVTTARQRGGVCGLDAWHHQWRKPS